mgnify:FL=1
MIRVLSVVHSSMSINFGLECMSLRSCCFSATLSIYHGAARRIARFSAAKFPLDLLKARPLGHLIVNTAQ